MTKRGWAAGLVTFFVAVNGGCETQTGGEEEIASAR